MSKEDLKKGLISRIEEVIQDKIELARAGVKSIQDSANDETKSSSGDKYETGREMMLLEKEKLSLQLSNALRLRNDMLKIDVHLQSDEIRTGSVVKTDKGTFFIALAVGNISYKGTEYYVISPVSPIGKILLGKKKGETITLNDRSFKIMDVW